MSLLLQCCLGTAQVVECSCKLAGETNPCDIKMATTICNAIVAVTAILVVGFLLWKLMEHIAKVCQEKRQRKWDEKDKDRKGDAEDKTRSLQLEDKAQKQKDDLRERKLAILKDLCYEVDEDGQKVLKKDRQDLEKYFSALDELLGVDAQQVPGKNEA